MKATAGHLRLVPKPLASARAPDEHTWMLVHVGEFYTSIVCSRCGVRALVARDGDGTKCGVGADEGRPVATTCTGRQSR
jgi:ribosomal protein L37E